MTLLLVEHDEDLRRLLRRVLNRHGRNLLVAADLKSALALLEHDERAIDLVIADVLPGMPGDTVAAVLRLRDPTLPVLLMNGGGDSAASTPELEKPFTPGELERCIREALSAATASAATGR